MSGTLLSLITLALMTAAACGGGAWILRLARIDGQLDSRQNTAVAFILGTGILGWVIFLVTLAEGLRSGWLFAICVVLATGLLFMEKPVRAAIAAARPLTTLQIVIFVLIAAALAFDILEAIPPPADADSLAYHFARPREFLAAGKIVFIPRASDGVHPVVQQMTYTTALGIGGERALTLWAMLSGWGTAAILYALARPYLSRDWAMALTLVFLTTPAVVYGAGSGQHEIRSTGFVLASVVLVIAARRTERPSLAALAGLAAGFFAASKYTGLLFLPIVGLALIVQRRWFSHGLAYSAAALLVTAPFYGWIWWNTGDPFYPMLYGLVDYKPDLFWSQEFQAEFREMFALEKTHPSTLLWSFVYPFLATLAPDPAFEADRTGFGPIALLIMPAAMAGLWARRKTAWQSPLWAAFFVCAGFYLIWYLFGASQRVRHFLPVYPLLLLCLAAAAERATQAWPALTKPLLAAAAGTVLIQLAVHAVFTVNHARFAFGGETPEAFLQRNVSGYDAAAWINAHLGKNDRLLHMERQLVYYLPPNSFYGHNFVEPRIDLRRGARDEGRFWDEMAAEGITHVLVPRPGGEAAEGGYVYLVGRLVSLGCAKMIVLIRARGFGSRTLAHLTETEAALEILELTPQACPLEPRR